MKTDSPTPDHDKLKALLAKSFHSEEAEDVPPLPDDLRDRIRDQYGSAAPATPASAGGASEGFFSKLFSLFSQPAYAGALGALALLVVVGFLLTGPKDPDGTRGPLNYTGASIVLYGVDEPLATAIKGALDPETVKSVSDLSDALAREGRTIIIDGKDGEIEGYRSKGAEPIIWPLPADPEDAATKALEMMAALKSK